MDGGKERTVSILQEQQSYCVSMQRSTGPLHVWVGREGAACGGQWAGRRLTVIGHSENGDLSDGSPPARHTARPLVDGGQVCVHVSREPSAPRHLLSGS